MRKNIVLFTGDYHSFILSDVKYASKHFEHVYFFGPNSQEFHDAFDSINNVKYICFPNHSHFKKVVLGLTQLRLRVIKDFIKAFFTKRMSKKYIKMLLLYLYQSYFFKKEVKNLNIKSGIDWVFLSLWFSGTAYAVSQIKKKIPAIKAISLAHSYEVDFRKNTMVDLFFKNYCHKYLNQISFISRNVMNEYKEKYALPHKWRTDSFSVNYLGVVRKSPLMQQHLQKDEDFKVLLSCSNLIPVKRVDLIVNSLRLINNIRIKWVHIGDGIDKERLQKMASDMPQNISVEWKGSLPNLEVQKFMANNRIDLFVNVSSSEGLPVSIMEALAYGIPVIATDVGGTSEIVNNYNGALLNSDIKPPELASAIVKELSVQTSRKKEKALETYKAFDADVVRNAFYSELGK